MPVIYFRLLSIPDAEDRHSALLIAGYLGVSPIGAFSPTIWARASTKRGWLARFVLTPCYARFNVRS
jgi:hypothetical protein